MTRILTQLSELPLTDYKLPPIVFTTDLDCSGTVFTSKDLSVRVDDGLDDMAASYASYTTLNTAVTAVSSAFTTENVTGKSLYLPRMSTTNTNTLTNVTTIYDEPAPVNKFAFRSIIVPPQMKDIELEGKIGGLRYSGFNNTAHHRFKYKTKGPIVISNMSSLKYQEIYDYADPGMGWRMAPAYYMSDRKTSLGVVYYSDLDKIGYDMSLSTFGQIFANERKYFHVHYRINVKESEPVETLIRKSCLGDLLYFGGKVIDRYLPQGPVCDTYMRNYCSITANVSAEVCGCFRDEASVLAKSILDNVALPVVCYGEHCATQNSYKTLAMKQLPCNRMLCKQEITGIKESGDNVVTCNGQYFSHGGQVKLLNEYYNVAAATEDPAKLAMSYESQVKNDRLESSFSSQPIYVWVCIAMAYLVMLIFALFYLFPPSFFKTLSSKSPNE